MKLHADHLEKRDKMDETENLESQGHPERAREERLVQMAKTEIVVNEAPVVNKVPVENVGR